MALPALLESVVGGADEIAMKRTGIADSPLHGGKDGHPYAVDRQSYDRSIEILKQAVENAKIGDRQKMEAIKRLKGIEGRKGGRRRRG